MQIVRMGMFDDLSVSLNKAWDIVRKDGKLTADNIKAPMREIRRALLEADVSLPTVRQFVKRVEEKALGVTVIKGVKPEQMLVRVVNDELVELMGGKKEGLNDPDDGPQVILMAGLQGVGKTTTCGKLALSLKKENRKVLLVATDVYRPAAIEQLRLLGRKTAVDVFDMGTDADPVEIATRGLEKARAEGYDTVIVDTAGRLQIDDSMMAELKSVQKAVNPSDTLLVVDSMTGQEAAGLVKAFNEAAPLTGAILTKMDGDSRGGAALSMKSVSGRPVKFICTGEKMENIEPFYPDRLASRILGMGDILSLVEMAESSIKESDAAAMMKKLMEEKFDFNDFLKNYKMVSGMGGGMSSVMKMLPGMSAVSEKQLGQAEKKFITFEAMIGKMTDEEKENPDLLAVSISRRRRIAKESGFKESDVAELLAQFTGMRQQAKMMSKRMKLSGMAMPGMSPEETMKAIADSSGPGAVSPGKVRREAKKDRKKGGYKSLAARELASLK